MNAAALAPIPHDAVSDAIVRLDVYAYEVERGVADLARLRAQVAGLLSRIDSALAEGEEGARRKVAEYQRGRRPRALMPGETGRPPMPLRDGGADFPVRVLPAGRFP